MDSTSSYPHPNPGLSVGLPGGLSTRYHFLPWQTRADCDTLIEQLPPGQIFGFFDFDYHRMSAPGAWIQLVRNLGGDRFLLKSGNHGWSSSWIPSHTTAVQDYLWGCRHWNRNPANTCVSISKQVRDPKDIDPDSPFAKRFANRLRELEEAEAFGTPLYGLVLRGGRSRRMGTDKAALPYHGEPEAERIFTLLGTQCERVFSSVGKSAPDAPDTLRDEEEDAGPMGGLRAAFKAQKHAAWLVLACDMPLFGAGALRQLVTARDPNHAATAFVAEDGKPHPLAAIYEPQVRMALGARSPRGMLLEMNDVVLVEPEKPSSLRSFDTPEERDSLL